MINLISNHVCRQMDLVCFEYFFWQFFHFLSFFQSFNTENESDRWFNLQVDTRLIDLRENGIASKSFLDGHVSSMGDIVSHAKTKWQSFCTQAEKDAKGTSDFSVAKHCRMAELLQQRYVLLLINFLVHILPVALHSNNIFSILVFSINTAESASKHTMWTHEVVNEIGTKHISAAVSLIRFVVNWLK